ncbi:MAG: ribose 5-phosphate isomerase B [Patescibacteria group bacterium]
MIFLSSDHAGYQLKEELKRVLVGKNIEFADLGTDSEEDVDYSDFGHALAEKVLAAEDSQGVGICGTGLGISMTLNRHTGIRAARCVSTEDAELARKHNDANVLVLAGREADPELAKEILEKFLNTDFEAGRHEDRVKKIDIS